MEKSANVAKMPAEQHQRRQTKKPVLSRGGRSAEAVQLHAEQEEDEGEHGLVLYSSADTDTEIYWQAIATST